MRLRTVRSLLAASPVVRRQLERATAQPFASPNGFVMVRDGGPMARDSLVVAQQQHHAVMDAIAQREGARAEAVMREHARLAHGNLSQALASRQAMARVPGGALIQRFGRP